MITIHKEQEEILKAFLHDTNNDYNVLHLNFSDYEKMAKVFPPFMSIRLEDDVSFQSMLDSIRQTVMKEQHLRLGSLILTIEYSSGNELTLEDMSLIREFLNGFDNNIEQIYSIGRNDSLTAKHAIELFVFENKVPIGLAD